MINYVTKGLFYQIAMACFLIATVSSNAVKIRSFVMLAYLFLMIWEYKSTGGVTIDVICWTILFYCLNIYMMLKKK